MADAITGRMPPTESSAQTDATLYAYMMSSHAQLRDGLIRLLDAMAANARGDVAALWSELDHGLLTHMEAEERFVLPRFAHVDPAEARGLLREHGQIREELLELGVAVDLHYLRFDRSEDFAQLLLGHAAREERLLYRWADAQLGPDAMDAVKSRVAAGGRA
jgi:Hemerythrin HHE cation binding domain